MWKIADLPHEKLVAFISMIQTDILKKEYPSTYSGEDLLTCMGFDLKIQCACGRRFIKIKNTLKDITNE